MLKIKSLDKSFHIGTVNETRVFDDFSLTIEEGDFITVIGSNGAGKSTLLNLISGDLEIDSGNLIYEGEDVGKTTNFERAKYMSRVFQDPSMGVSPSMTILENLSMAWNKNNRNPFSKGIRTKQREYFKEILKECELGLEDMLDKQVNHLSGGQKQALSLIMAIIHQPKILLLDEHTAALDPNTAHKILEITERLVRRDSVTTMMITHNMNDAIKYGNRLLMLDKGKIILDLDSDEKQKMTSEKLIEHFKQLKVKEIEDRFVLV
jgi:putative tryptophan/tyrosine transport system ATP-binding protein